MKLAWLALIPLLSCETDGAYLYLGYKYEPGPGCIDAVSALDVLAGSDPGTSCSPRCIAGAGDASMTVFASKECGPPPPVGDVSGTNPLCPGALAALAAGNFCPDAGSSDAGGD